MKGQSVIITTVIGIAISIIVFGIIAFGSSQYYTIFSERAQLQQAEVLSTNIGTRITNLYNNHQDSEFDLDDGENVTVAEINMTVPFKIARNPYEITTANRGKYWATLNFNYTTDDVDEVSIDRQYSSIIIVTTGNNPIRYRFPLDNLPVDIEGESVGKDEITISYLKENDNGTIKNIIVVS